MVLQSADLCQEAAEDEPLRVTHAGSMLVQIFSSLCVKDIGYRQRLLDRLTAAIQAWVREGKPPKEIRRLLADYRALHGLPVSMLPTLADTALFLLVWATQCPIPDLRRWCLDTLDLLEKHGVPRPYARAEGPSAFIAASELLSPISTTPHESQAFFLDAFLQNNRVDNFTQLIALHPQYLDLFLKTQSFIMRGDGPLPYAYRHYIAILAAARHHCTYLIDLQKQEFLHQGGNAMWLLSLDNIPQKLKNLLEINKILAHRPWLLNKSHIERLVKAKGKDNWSVSELVHAIVILTHFHSLCSFIYGTGIMPEVDQENGHTFTSPTREHRPALNGTAPKPATGEVEELVEKMQQIEKQHRQQEPSMEELVSTFKKVESQCAELPAGQCRTKPTLRAELHRFLEDPDFTYQDFAKRKEPTEIPTFRIQDYSWDDHGFSLANRLYNDVGTLLDQKFKTAYDLTYYTMGVKNNVDTSMFRRAIWNYIQCLYGIRHDDYDYKEVNDLIERSLKNHIKTVCCYPDRTTKKDYESVMRDFRHSEKIHVNLMLLEARMQAELLYALRAVMHYMT